MPGYGKKPMMRAPRKKVAKRTGSGVPKRRTAPRKARKPAASKRRMGPKRRR